MSDQQLGLGIPAEAQQFPRDVPTGYDLGKCRGCRAEVIWAYSLDPITLRPKVRDGKPVKSPIDVRPVANGTLIFDGSRGVRAIGKGELIAPELRRQSHFASCPARQRFKRGDR